MNPVKAKYIKKCPKIKTLIHWYDLPKNKIVKLDKKFQKAMLMKIYLNLKYGQKKRLAQRLNLGRSYIKDLFNLKSNFSIGSLKRVCREAKVSLNDLEKHIVEFGRRRVIKNPKFPFNMSSKEGITLRSIINSEGHISKQIGRSVMIRVPEIDMLNEAIKISKKLFGKFDIEIKKTEGKNTNEIYLPGEIGDILVISGLTRGRKSVKNPYIPKDIMLGSLDKKRTYLQWSIAGEMECARNSKALKITRYVNVSDIISKKYLKKLKRGAIFKKDISSRIISKLSKKPPNLLSGESLMFKDFGIMRKPYIKCLWKHKNDDLSCAWTIPITNKKEISILYNKINVPLKEKRDKVKKVLFNYVDNILDLKTYKSSYKKLKKLHKEKKFIRRKDLINDKEDINEERKIDRHLNVFVKEGYLSKISPGIYKLIK